ncbi:MAG: gliding motility protein GldN [Saprospiraceae bacterium]|nr:gliding motility protein GldN [Saprospiraceae bacterium]MCB9308507.1 gliding motility protein GldN [Lewinellaceae bacterium]
MKSYFSFLYLSVLIFASQSVGAQVQPLRAEEIKTESSQPTEDAFVDDIVVKRIVVENRLMAQQPIREADISWEKRIQRVIDTREKLNLPFRSQELNLFNVFKEMIINKEITAFSDEQFKNVLSAEEVEGKMVSYDTIIALDPDTYEELIKIAKNDINWEKVNQYRIKEVWYFDKQRSVMDVRILGIAPIYQSPKDEEAGIPPAPIFWIYYPEARTPLSKHRVFNDENDIAPMTWADLFDQREFSSYIYKRSNVLDYRLKDFYVPDPNDDTNRSGVDLLLHSEKIKNELLNFELDLWEY